MSDAYDFWAQRLPRAETEAIDAFWDRFVRIAQDLDRHLLGREPGFDAHGEMKRALGPLADQLFYEFGETEPDGQTLAVTAELFHSRRALARAVLLRAPEIPGWHFSDTRKPVVRMRDVIDTVLIRSRADEIAVESIDAQKGPHRLVDLEAVGQGDHDFVADQAGIIFAVLLGDVADQNWLGTSRATTKRGVRARFVRRFTAAPEPERWLPRLREKAVEIISSFEAERPQLPFAETRMQPGEMVEFRLDPKPGDRSARNDAITYHTRYRSLLATRVAKRPVSSLRFSRFFESFCGLKIMRDSGLPADFESEAGLGELARDVEAALTSAGVGGVTGHGQGLEHLYIDLALEDVELSLGILRTTLARADITAPVWMLFDEAGLQDRYFPLTEAAPMAPPGGASARAEPDEPDLPADDPPRAS